MAQRILKNNTASPVNISDTGGTVPASGQLVINPVDYGVYEGSSDVVTLIGDSTLTVNDGTFDLSINEGTRLIQGGFSRPISDGSDPTIKAGVTSATGVSEHNNRLQVENVMAGRDSLGNFRRVNSVVRGDGVTAVPIDGVVSVQSTFGFDQLPDSFFTIINTGGAGTTWEIYIAGTNADPSTPDRDLPSYSKTFTVLVAEEFDELSFRDRIITELNQDTVFRDTCFLKAQKATDRGVVHIYSEKFSASGEFYERPLAGDFAVTIAGSPGDGVVIVGFDNLISRSKPVTITRDFDSPHRLGLFGVTGDLNIAFRQLADLFLEKASLDGLGVTVEMSVNGSTTEKVYLINARSTQVFVQSVRFYGQGNGIQFGKFLNLNNTLTNGILVNIKSENIVTTLFPIKATENFKNEFSFGSGANGFEVIFASGRDEFLATFDFTNPFLISEAGAFGAGNDDYIEIRIRDNLSQVGSLQFLAKGFEKEP